MKKFVSIFLSLVLLASLAACGSSSSGEVIAPSEAPAANETVTENTPAPEKAEEIEAAISETVLVDEAGVKITAKSFAPDEMFGPEIKLLIENDSGKDLTFQTRNASVNGYMVETMLSADVADGKKANDSLTFMRDDLDVCGIGTVADMEFSFHIFTSDSWEDYLDTPLIQIKTTAADTYEYQFDDSGEVVYEGNDVKIVVKGLSEDDSIYGPSIMVYIENNGDKAITVQAQNVSVNGFMIDPIFSCDVGIGKHAVDTITFFSSDLEENEITDIETVELSFHIFDMESWNTIVNSDVITLAF